MISLKAHQRELSAALNHFNVSDAHVRLHEL
jgi:hypothetical protein